MAASNDSSMLDNAAINERRRSRELVTLLSTEAFELAKKVAAGQAQDADVQTAAWRIRQALDETVAVTHAASRVADPSLAEAWSDARLDVMFVLAKGKGPSSLRLAAFVRRTT